MPCLKCRHKARFGKYKNWQLDTAAMPASIALKALVSEETGYPVPALNQPVFTLTESWALALTHPDESQQALGLLLMQDLTNTDFLAKWSEALGYVPACQVDVIGRVDQRGTQTCPGKNNEYRPALPTRRNHQ